MKFVVALEHRNFAFDLVEPVAVDGFHFSGHQTSGRIEMAVREQHSGVGKIGTDRIEVGTGGNPVSGVLPLLADSPVAGN